jgi:hypothetical protein
MPKISLLLLSIAFGLLLSEYAIVPALLSLTDQPGRSLTLLGVAGKPNTQVDDTKLNSEGFTGDVPTELKPANTVRILTLGGSAIFNRRMTERLSYSLKRATPTRLEIEGAALRTHTTRDSVIKYAYHFTRYKFDYVMIYDAANDLWMNHVSADDFREDYSHARPQYKRNFFLDHSLIARLLYNRFLWTRKCVYANPGSQCYNAAHFRAYKTYERNIRELIRLVRNDGGVPILLTFAWNIPANYTKARFDQGTLGYNNPTNYDKCPVEFWGDVEYVREGVRQNNQIVRAIANEERTLLIDEEEMFSNNTAMFGDPFHFSEEGTDMFVKSITHFFVSKKMLPSYSSPSE